MVDRAGDGSIARGRAIEVRDQVVDRLDTEREPDHVGPGASRDAFLVAELAMRRRRGVQDEAASVADVGEM